MTGLSQVAPEHEAEPSVSHVPVSRFPTRYLKAVQRYSAYGIATFAGLHLTSTVVLPAISVPAANSAFMVARDVYQSTLGEPILVYAAFGTHIISGIALRLRRIYTQYSDFGKVGLGSPSCTTITGYILTVMVLGHYGAMRWAPVAALGDSSLMSLDYVVYALNGPEWLKTSGILGLLTTIFGLHALQGASSYFGSIRRLWKSSISRYLITTALVTWCAMSIGSLAKVDPAQGWLADQFDLIHHTFENQIKILK